MKVISYSLYGTHPKYYLGMLRNVQAAPKIYPGWEVFIYVPHKSSLIWEDLPPATFAHLEACEDLGARVIHDEGNLPPMFWRFQPADDLKVERFMVRDADSRLSFREALAVEQWIEQDTCFHVMRDHPAHCCPMLGGMWGAQWRKANWEAPPMKDLMAKFLAENTEPPVEYGFDQLFLAKMIWPWARTSATQHDCMPGRRKEYMADPFPAKRENFPRFVGEVIELDANGNDVPRDDDWRQMRKDME